MSHDANELARAVPSDLVDNDGAAEILGLKDGRGISVYRNRHEDFPRPWLERRQIVLWLRREIEEWDKAHPERRRRRS